MTCDMGHREMQQETRGRHYQPRLPFLPSALHLAAQARTWPDHLYGDCGADLGQCPGQAGRSAHGPVGADRRTGSACWGRVSAVVGSRAGAARRAHKTQTRRLGVRVLITRRPSVSPGGPSGARGPQGQGGVGASRARARAELLGPALALPSAIKDQSTPYYPIPGVLWAAGSSPCGPMRPMPMPTPCPMGL
jgi:hypothetical protein